MTESQFIEQNKEKWKELESLLMKKEKDADELQDLFVKISSDLSYARTFYPNRSVRLYLNNLTQRVFDSMGRSKQRPTLDVVLLFFKETLPLEVYRSKSAFLTSFLVFILAVLIGVVSSANRPDFARIIMGDQYIDMTDENINDGDPMAVYKSQHQVNMFLGITINNVRVAFMAFVLGIIGSMGTVILLLFNGIMVGAFQYYFYSKGLFLTSFLTIWIHGTIEISAIIIAGAAGIILGNGLLFPRTYERLTSLQISAKRALKIVLGTVPLFIIAGILESFVTRQTELPLVAKVGLIVLSALFIILYWVVLPMKVGKAYLLSGKAIDPAPEHVPQPIYRPFEFRTIAANAILSFNQLRGSFGLFLQSVLLPGLLAFSLVLWYRITALGLSDYELDEGGISFFDFQYGGLSLFVMLWIFITYLFVYLGWATQGSQYSNRKLEFLKQYLPILVSLALIVLIPFYFVNFWVGLFILACISPQFIAVFITKIATEERSLKAAIKEEYQFCLKYFFNFVPAIGLCLLFLWVTYYLLHSGLSSYISDYISWHEIFLQAQLNDIYLSHILTFCAYVMVAPFTYFLMVNQYRSERCRIEATDLRNRFESFGTASTILES